MAALLSVGRSTSRLIHVTSRATTVTATKSPTRISLSPSIRSQILPSSSLRTSRISPSSPRLWRRELSSLLPVHSAIASACLVSKLPSDASTSAEGNLCVDGLRYGYRAPSLGFSRSKKSLRDFLPGRS